MKLGQSIRYGGIIVRVLSYACYYVPITFAYIFILITSEPSYQLKVESQLIANVLACIMMFVPTLIPFVVWEMKIRAFRKKHGLSIFKNVYDELKELEAQNKV